MANKDFNLDLKMRADFKQAQAELRKAQGDIEKVVGTVNTANLRGQAMAGVLRTTAAAITGAGIVAAAMMAKYVANTIEAEKVQAQLLARIKDTGGAAGRTIDQLGQQAEDLQKLTVFDDEAIGSAQAMLLTFKEIQGVQFDKAVEATLDLSTAMGTDLNSAALMVGKALNDPVKGLSAMSRAGVQFSKDQEELIKKLVETGDKAKAQEIILAELGSQMGTAAEAARDTLGGALQALQNSFDNLLEGDSGDAGVEGTREAIEELIRLFNDPATKAGFDTMAGYLVQMANFAAKAIAAVGGLGQAISDELAANTEKSRTGLLARRADLADDLSDMEKGGLAGMASLMFGEPGKVNIFGRSGSVGLGTSDAEIIAGLRAEIAEIDTLLRVNSSLRGAFDPNFTPGKITVNQRGQGVFSNVLGTGEVASAGHTTPTPDPDKDKSGKKSDPDADIKRRIASLKEEAALLGAVKEGEEKASEAAKVRYAITVGEFKDKPEQLKQELLLAAEALDAKNADIEAEKARQKALEETQESFEDLREELRTPAEAALEGAIAQVETLNAAIEAGIQGAAEFRDEALAKIAGGLTEDQPDFQGLAPEVGGAFGELQKLEEAREKEEAWYEESLQRLADFRAAKAENAAAADAEEERIEALHQDRMRQIEQSRQQAALSIASDFFGQLATLQRSENSKIAAVGKAAAIAQALINTYQSATSAYAAMAAIPVVGPALGVAAAAAAIAAGLANVAQIRSQPVGYATGGRISGPGTGTSDSVPIMASAGEFMVREASAGQPGAYAFLEDFNRRGMDALYGWARYADGGVIADRPRLSEPNWEGMAAARQTSISNSMRVYYVQNEDELAQRLAQHPAMEKAVIAFAGQNGTAIRAEW